MRMIRIVADHKIPFLQGALEPFAHVEYLPGREISNPHLKDADALLVRTRTRCDEKLLKGSSVKFIATATIGHDHIDADYCQQHGIRWINAPGCNAGSVQQYVASAIAYIIGFKKADFSELTLGIIGAGHIGSKVQSLAETLGIKCLLNDPPRQRMESKGEFTALDELLIKSDIVSLHVPLNLQGTDKTLHMADAGFFSKMKKEAWFINTARGEVHHTSSLLEALESRQLEGAILDVWEKEPFIDPQLLKAAAIATPHIAGYSLDGKANGTVRCVQAISRFFNLGIDNWRPESIPLPANPVLSFDCRNISPEELFSRLTLSTYDPREDSYRLKQSPLDFEVLREDYPVRREARAFRVFLENKSAECHRLVQQLGFQSYEK